MMAKIEKVRLTLYLCPADVYGCVGAARDWSAEAGMCSSNFKMRKNKADVTAVISKFGLTANFTFTSIFTFLLYNFYKASRRNFVAVFWDK